MITQMKELHARQHKSPRKRSTEDYKNGSSNKYFMSNFRGNKIKKKKLYTGRFFSFSENIFGVEFMSCAWWIINPHWIIKRYCAASVQCN